ncbi:MAG: type I-B CRISPR-associated endonuclease Cas1b [Bacteroidia bacterium]|nr:type I-B CRISPR-associated endonuclease Cas1b [Bacteroidia bacterium]
MKKSYYLFNPGRLSRQDQTLKFTPVDEQGQEGQPRFLPVETVDNLYVFGSLDANSALYTFLGKQHISVHFFDYYEHYCGSFYPKEYLLAGKLHLQQALHYSQPQQRMTLARHLVEGAAWNMRKNLAYYDRRERDLSHQLTALQAYVDTIPAAADISALMGLEGNIRQQYYSAFDEIIRDFEMGGRSKQPPANEVNALISFGNMMCYTACLDQIYHTQLDPTISFLHEPGTRRYSLALDLAEIFKPILVDRLVFTLLNKKQLQPRDFETTLNGCLLREPGRKTFVQAWDERLKETLQHRSLGRKVSYRHLIKLECYKLSKHLMGIEPYKPFKAWW